MPPVGVDCFPLGGLFCEVKDEESVVDEGRVLCEVGF